MTKVNKNDVPLKNLSDLEKEVQLVEYEYLQYFSHLCQLKPERDRERLVITEDGKRIDERGLVYIMSINGRIFKIGSTSTAFTDRVSSYNCGRKKARAKGTCSTTNFYILQTLLNFDSPVDVLCFFSTKQTFEFLGEGGEEAFPPAKVMETIFLRKFKEKYGKLPIACTQG